MNRLLALFLLAPLAACTAEAAPQPTADLSPATPEPDTCDEAKFLGTFDFPAAVHQGDTPYCEASAAAWNALERPRALRFQRELDGSWTSRLVEAPEAGTTAYALDATECALKVSSSARINDRDQTNALVSVPVRTVTAVRLTDDGISMEVDERYDPSSNILGLPCTTTSLTNGVRL